MTGITGTEILSYEGSYIDLGFNTHFMLPERGAYNLSCPEHKSKTIQVTDLKLQKWIDLIMKKSSAQEPKLSAS